MLAPSTGYELQWEQGVEGDAAVHLYLCEWRELQNNVSNAKQNGIKSVELTVLWRLDLFNGTALSETLEMRYREFLRECLY